MMDINEALAALDARRRFAGKQMSALLSDPLGQLGQWGTQTLEDAAGGARTNLDASQQMMNPATRQQGMATLLQSALPLSVHQFRGPKGVPPTYDVTEHSTGNLPDLSGLPPEQIRMWLEFLKKQADQSNVIQFPSLLR